MHIAATNNRQVYFVSLLNDNLIDTFHTIVHFHIIYSTQHNYINICIFIKFIQKPILDYTNCIDNLSAKYYPNTIYNKNCYPNFDHILCNLMFSIDSIYIFNYCCKIPRNNLKCINYINNFDYINNNYLYKKNLICKMNKQYFTNILNINLNKKIQFNNQYIKNRHYITNNQVSIMNCLCTKNNYLQIFY